MELISKTIRLFNRLQNYIQRDIWQFSQSESKSQLKVLFRVLLISLEGIKENLLLSRAAALSYSSLIGLGPIIAVLVLLSGIFIKADPETQLKEALLFISPSLGEYISINSTDKELSELDLLTSQIISGSESMMDKVNTGGSAIFGIIGLLVLVWVGIQLLTTIEKTLNEIWGIKKGRPWNQRVVYYWTFLSLGGILGLGSTALFSAGNIAGMFNWLPQGKAFGQVVLQLSPLISFLMLVILLTVFYSFFPNTKVKWKAAFYGSLLTTILLICNNFLSLIYVQKVITFGSLYGSLGIIPVLMFGMYFFWVFILLGGVLTYAIQNCHILNNQAAWKAMSPLTRKTLCLSVFTTIARRFQNADPPLDLEEISNILKVPTDALNESIEKLIEMEWVHVGSSHNKELDEETTCFLPSKPLNQIKIQDFQIHYDRLGNSTSLPHLAGGDSIISQFIECASLSPETNFSEVSIEDLIRRKHN